MVLAEQQHPIGVTTDFSLRPQAEAMLESGIKRSIFLDPLSLPIAGLRAIIPDGVYPSLGDVPKEVLPFADTPFVIIDLDDSLWPHAEAFVHAVGEASGKPITMDEYRIYGYSREVPKWKNDPRVMKIHDDILQGKNPIYFPFMNPAYPDAVKGVHAIERMGHNFIYYTARQRWLYETTRQTLRWNRLPLSASRQADGQFDVLPQTGKLYLVENSVPGIADKSVVAAQWLENLRSRGWHGKMVIIDDLLTPYKDIIHDPQVVAISLANDVNISRQIQTDEHRVNSWSEISEILMRIHEKAVANSALPYREFTLRGTQYRFDKSQTGNGVFSYSSIR